MPKITNLEQILEAVGIFQDYLKDITEKGINGVKVSDDFIAGYEKAIEDFEGYLHD